MEKIIVEHDKLFNVTVVRKYGNETERKIVSLKNLKHMLDYFYSYRTITVNYEMSPLLPKYELFLVGHCSGRCYSRQDYKLVSEREMSEDNFNMLRQFRAFMNGQRCGEMVKHYQENGKHVYELVSEVDSSD